MEQKALKLEENEQYKDVEPVRKRSHVAAGGSSTETSISKQVDDASAVHQPENPRRKRQKQAEEDDEDAMEVDSVGAEERPHASTSTTAGTTGPTEAGAAAKGLENGARNRGGDRGDQADRVTASAAGDRATGKSRPERGDTPSSGPDEISAPAVRNDGSVGRGSEDMYDGGEEASEEGEEAEGEAAAKASQQQENDSRPKELRILTQGAPGAEDGKLDGNYWQTEGVRTRRGGICGAVEHLNRTEGAQQQQKKPKKFEVESRYDQWCAQLKNFVVELGDKFGVFTEGATEEKEALLTTISAGGTFCLSSCLFDVSAPTPHYRTQFHLCRTTGKGKLHPAGAQTRPKTMQSRGLGDIEDLVLFLWEATRRTSPVLAESGSPSQPSSPTQRQEAIAKALTGLAQWSFEAPELAKTCGELCSERDATATKAREKGVALAPKLAQLARAAEEETRTCDDAVEKAENRIDKLEEEEAALVKRLAEVRERLAEERNTVMQLEAKPAEAEYDTCKEEHASLDSAEAYASHDAGLMQQTASYLAKVSDAAMGHYTECLLQEVHTCSEALDKAHATMRTLVEDDKAEETAASSSRNPDAAAADHTDEVVTIPLARDPTSTPAQTARGAKLHVIAQGAALWLERMKIMLYEKLPPPLAEPLGAALKKCRHLRDTACKAAKEAGVKDPEPLPLDAGGPAPSRAPKEDLLNGSLGGTVRNGIPHTGTKEEDRAEVAEVPAAAAGKTVKRRLFNKVVTIPKGIAPTQDPYFYVVFYDEVQRKCKVAPMTNDGRFGKGGREGRLRWKVSSDASKEHDVPSDACSILKSTAVNKVSDIDKETWDIHDQTPDQPPTVAAKASTTVTVAAPKPAPLALPSKKSGKHPTTDQKVTAVVYSYECLNHQTPKWHPERPERVSGCLDTLGKLRGRPGVAFCETKSHASWEAITLAHCPSYIDWLQTQVAAAGERPRRLGPNDEDTFVCNKSFDAAMYAAGACCHAADLLMTGAATRVFCCVRPPGHHAGRTGGALGEEGQGFCLLNNLAITAAYARAKYPQLRRIAVLDWDVHHGNGTEDIMINDEEVLFLSLHRSGGGDFFPHTEEPGQRHAPDQDHNTTFDKGFGSKAFRAAMKRCVARIEEFAPDLVLISAGFDAHREDPLGGALLHESDFRWATTQLVHVASKVCNGRILSALEGGYDVPALSKCVLTHVEALVKGDVPRKEATPGEAGGEEEEEDEEVEKEDESLPGIVCSTCTLVNAPGARKCAACDERLGTPNRAQAPFATEGVEREELRKGLYTQAQPQSPPASSDGSIPRVKPQHATTSSTKLPGQAGSSGTGSTQDAAKEPRRVSTHKPPVKQQAAVMQQAKQQPPQERKPHLPGSCGRYLHKADCKCHLLNAGPKPPSQVKPSSQVKTTSQAKPSKSNGPLPGVAVNKEKKKEQRRLPNKVVLIKEKSCSKHKYWLVVYYDEPNSLCKVAPMLADGEFGKGTREGRPRWKVDPSPENEKVIEAGLCTISPSHAVNKVSDIDKEKWDIFAE